MVWLIFGGVGVLVIVAAVCVWTVVALLAEVGDEQSDDQDAATSDPLGVDDRSDSSSERRRVHHRVARY
ncbi:hypothetical protein [Glaciihabitans sp. INWT7]|uniref:hypothetical protein n=1 Tax=Glaciihabitans sp. INWT7 TaxID=2596912 RepID=UPI001626C130|nr:hypothetical protein [Glaciihabitans sp. INWT7]